MGYYDRHERQGRGLGPFILVLLGAVLGTALTIAAFFYGVMPALPGGEDPSANGGPQREEPRGDLPLPEHQNTAVVRAAQEAIPAVVGVSNRKIIQFRGSSQLQEVGSGSGVIINSEGLIVTNYHVIHEAAEVIVTFPDGTEVQAEIVGADEATDLAVLKANIAGLRAASFGDSDQLQVGELAIAIGNPLGLAFQQTVTLGVISATERYIQASEYRFAFIQTDAAINPGNSGGALVNLKGEVVGINTAKINLPGFEGMGFAIPSKMVESIVRELVEHGRVIRPWMGVVIEEITPLMAESLGLPVTSGVLVREVMAGSPAEGGGLMVGDIIIQVEDARVQDFDDLRQSLFTHRPGDTVDVKIFRDREEMTLPVTLGELQEESQ